jgi:hypothetical protein
VPAFGTFWWVVPGGAALPTPCPPPDLSGAIYQIADGQFLVDETGGQVVVNPRRLGLQTHAQVTSSIVASAAVSQADALVNLISQVQTTTENQEIHTLSLAMGMDVSGPPTPGDGSDSGGTNSSGVTGYVMPDYGTNLWIAQVAVASGNLTGIGTNTQADIQYDILSRTNLVQTDWQTENSIFGSENNNWTPFSVAQNNRTNLFIRLRSDASTDGSGLPDWWELEYFGTTGVNPYGNPAGDGWNNLQKFQNGMNPNVFYTPAAPQGVTVSYKSSTGAANISWLPSSGNVTGYAVKDSDGNTFNASGTSLNLTVPYAPVLNNANNGNPTMSKSYQVQSQYQQGNSALSKQVALQPSPVTGYVVPAPGGGNELIVSGIPSNAVAVRIFMYDEGDCYADNSYFNFSETTNWDIPVNNFSNGVCPVSPSLWDIAQLPSFPDAVSTYWAWRYSYLQAVDTQGNVTGGSYLMDDKIEFGPDFYDGRVQMKQNLIFQLRAAPEDNSFGFNFHTTINNGYGSFGAWGGTYTYPSNYVSAGLYPFGVWDQGNPQVAPLDPFLPFEQNALHRNFVYNPADVDANGELATGADNEENYLALNMPITYQFQTNEMALPSLLATNDSRWITYDGYVNGDCLNLDWDQMTVSMSPNVRNWFGLPFISTMLFRYKVDDGGNYIPPMRTNILAAGTSLPFTYYDIFTFIPSREGWQDMYFETAQPQFQLVKYCFYRYQDYWFKNDCLPGSPLFLPDSQNLIVGEDGSIYGTNNLPLMAGVGNSTQIAGYAQLAVLNGYSGVYAYLGQYFDKAYKVDDNGNVTTNQTGVLSPYGYYFATDVGVAALVTMPDIDTGERGTCMVYSVSLQVDKNHDGTMDASFNGLDVTSQASPMEWWVNNDNDGTGIGKDIEVMSGGPVDYQYGNIRSQRNLEDFSRLWICGLPKLPKTNGYTITLSMSSVSGNPAINLYRSYDANGSASYLSDTNAAAAQFTQYYFGDQLIFDYSQKLGTISPNQTYTLPVSTDGTPDYTHFIFEGAGIGEGQLTMTISQNVNTLSQSSVWLDLHDVKDFYERAVITNNMSGTMSNWTSAVEIVQPATSLALSDDTNLIVLVHGINVRPWDCLQQGDTVFKRLYWAGFHGKFASVKWPCNLLTPIPSPLSPANFNLSEMQGYKASTALTTYLNQLRSRFPGDRLNILAHSQGNSVVSEAIANGLTFDTYILTQGALPASAYDFDAPTNVDLSSYEYRGNYTPDLQPIGYHGIYTNFTGRIVNFYNPQDGVLDFWIKDQKYLKPSIYLSSAHYFYDGTTSYYFPFVGPGYQVSDPEESRAMVARSRTLPIGQSGPASPHGVIQSAVDLNAQFNFNDATDEHSAQWTRPIQTTSGYYLQIRESIKP